MVLFAGLPLAVLVTAFAIILAKRRNRKRMAAQEAETQRQLSEAQQRYNEAERELQTKMEQAAQHTREVLQQRAMTIYQSGGGNRLKQILAEFEAVYPQALSELAVAHPELSETEWHRHAQFPPFPSQGRGRINGVHRIHDPKIPLQSKEEGRLRPDFNPV